MLYRAALLIDLIKLPGQMQGFGFIIGHQAAYAQAHVRQTTSSIDARANFETQVSGTGFLEIATGNHEKRLDAGLQVALADFVQPLGNQQAVIAV